MPTGNPSLRLGERRYDLTHRCLVQGVLPSQGATAELERNVARAGQLVADGADVLEIAGGEQVDGVSLLVEALATRFDVPVAVRTARAEILAAGCAAGAVAGNDRSGFADPDYLPTAARCGATVVAPRPDRADHALAAGLAADRVILDAGLDRATTGAEAVGLLRTTEALARLGYPLLLALSDVPDLDTPARSLAAAAYGVAHGGRIVRVRDVAGTVRAVRLVERILEARAQVGAAQ